MATLKAADVWSLDGDNAATVSIPHDFKELVEGLYRNGGPETRIPVIRYVRTAFKDSKGYSLGLKDAKDIVCFYARNATPLIGSQD